MSLSPTSQRVAANVRAEIARQGFTQSSLAEKIGRDQHFISRRVSGKVPFDLEELGRIADALGISVSELIGEEKASA